MHFFRSIYLYGTVLGLALSEPTSLDLFGGTQSWDSKEFVAVDDRLRGGSSQSYLKVFSENNTAVFCGTLDTKTLGGAGFATQSKESPSPIYDFTGYTGLDLQFINNDHKEYVLDLSNEYSAFLPNGSKPSMVDFQATFSKERAVPVLNTNALSVYLPFADFIPIERGRPSTKPSVDLDLKNIRKVAFQIRSFFDQQSGPFSLTLIKLSLHPSTSPNTFFDQQS